MSPEPRVISILASEVEIATWNSQGLPVDSFSTENGIVMCNTTRWPLLIDPQLQVCGVV
jgi:dynein heavy chain